MNTSLSRFFCLQNASIASHHTDLFLNSKVIRSIDEAKKRQIQNFVVKFRIGMVNNAKNRLVLNSDFDFRVKQIVSAF